MGPSARVLSVEALEVFHAALARFGAKAEEVLGTAGMTIRRTLDELQERHRYWVRELRERGEEVSRIRSALSFARMRHDGKAVGCAELELELQKAVRRQREAEGKLESVRRWQQALPQAVREYEGPVRKLTGFLESDVRQALSFMQAKMASLEAYLAMTGPGEESSVPAQTAATPGPQNEKSEEPPS